MSFIFGVFNKKSNVFVSEDTITLIQNSIKREGISSKVTHINENIGFGYHKLDSSENVSQKSGLLVWDDYIITADVKLSNSIRLCTDLSILSSSSDAEIILAAYTKWGSNCVNFLEGEFVFAIWNKILDELFIATDHIGTRSIYYYDTEDIFIFGSEIKCIEAVKKTTNYFNDECIFDYYGKNADVAETFNSEIKYLKSARYLSISYSQLKAKQYWGLSDFKKHQFKTDNEWIAAFKKLFYETIEKQIDLNVPIGISLSGGLDSASITCVLAEFLLKNNKPLYTFSSVLSPEYTGPKRDERIYIESLKDKYPNIISTYIESDKLNPFSEIDKSFEETEFLPNAFYYMDRAIVKESQKKGVKILFYGYGGDNWVSYKGAEIPYQLLKEGNIRKSWKLVNDFRRRQHKSYVQIIKEKYVAYMPMFLKITRLKNKKNKINWQNFTPLQDSFLKSNRNKEKKYQPYIHANYVAESIDSGKLGKSLFYINTNSQNLGIYSVNPMLNKEILCFLKEMPLSIFAKDGLNRSLIRNTMKDVLPEIIFNRTNKSPYVSDFQKKTLQKQQLDFILKSNCCNLFFEKYIDKNSIETYFNEINSELNVEKGRNIVGVRISQAIILFYVFLELEKKSTHFKKSLKLFTFV